MMKDLIDRILKNKFNIVLVIIQIVAVLCFLLGQRFVFGTVMFFILEGGFLITWGIKLLIEVRNSKYSEEIVNQLPYTQDQREYIFKKNKRDNKNNKFMAFMLIALGIVVIFTLFSSIF